MANPYLSNSINSLMCLLCIILLVSCAAPPPIVKSEPEMRSETRQVVAKPVEAPVVTEKVMPQPNVAIVLSSDASVFQAAAQILETHLGDQAKRYVLTTNKVSNNQLMDQIQQSAHGQVIAIGIKATQLAANLEDKLIIFCQVPDHQAKSFIDDKLKGVSAFPSAEKLFQDWKRLYPGLNQVLVITGPNLKGYMANARQAAGEHGIELIHQVVKTDKEFLYVTKTTPMSVQGQWYFPDSRIISRKALKEALTFNAKEGRQSVVFSPALLSLGGFFYSMVSVDDVVQQVQQRLLDALGNQEIPGKGIQLLQKHEIGINPVVAKQMGVNIPADYKKYIYERK